VSDPLDTPAAGADPGLLAEDSFTNELDAQASPPSMALPSGSRVGNYLLGDEIARGGFGVVYRATDIERGAAVAVKVLHAELTSNPNLVLRFEREVDVIRRLRHPNVIEVFDCGRLDDGRPFFAMELLSGTTLDQTLARRGRLSIEETLGILEPLAGALDTVHAQSIVHRDIKTSNVFLCEGREAGKVVLLDFGVAKLLDTQDPALTASRQIIGTILYMAPEQLLGKPVDRRADVYALGVLAFAMLTGQMPFDTSGFGGQSPLSFLYARPPAPSQRARISAAFDEPILRALQREPAERPASAGAFVAELCAAMELARSAEAAPQGTLSRGGIAVHVEVVAEPSVLEDPDELLLMDLEAILPFVSAELSEVGLSVVMETGNNLLMVAEQPGDPELSSSFGRRVVQAVLGARSRLEQRAGRDPRIGIGFVVHTGALVITSDGALLGGGLLDPASWVPACVTDGVLVSNPVSEWLGLTAEPAPDARGFRLIRDETPSGQSSLALTP
jgi:serine/threonine-protein kinase